MCLFQLWRIVVLLADKTEDLSLGVNISDSSRGHPLRGKGGARKIGVFQQRPGSWSIKRMLLWWWLFSHQIMSNSLWALGLQHPRLPHPSVSPRVCSNSHLLNLWCNPTISSSVTLFFWLQSFQHQGLFQWVGSSHQVAKILELQHQKNIVH